MSSDVESSASTLLTYKIVFLGEQSGKTSIVTRFMFGHFETKYQATIGIDFLSKTVKFENVLLRLQLWDTAGQERFRSLIPSYIRDSSAAVVIYDITDANSFAQSSRWVADVRAERGKGVVVMLVGNKCDQVEKRQVRKEAGEAKARDLNALFMETSAKDGTNIEQLFRGLITQLPVAVDVSRRISMQVVPLDSPKQKQDNSKTCPC